MSEENVETVREAFEAFNRGDLDAALQRMHPDVQWETVSTFPDAGTYRGREDVAGFWRTWRDSFSWVHAALGGLRAIGRPPRPRHLSRQWRGSRERDGVESPAVFQLGEIHDGQVVWVRMFLTESEALEAASLRE